MPSILARWRALTILATDIAQMTGTLVVLRLVARGRPTPTPRTPQE